MLAWLTRRLCRLWEVDDKIPEKPVSAMVYMTLSLKKDGSPSKILDTITRKCAELYRAGLAPLIVVSNQQTIKGHNIALIARRRLVECGVPEDSVVIPSPEENATIWNTRDEARFALQQGRARKGTSILVVANHIHMRRVLATFRRVMAGNTDVDLFWVSVRDFATYGEAGGFERKFKHPLVFLAYELVVAGPYFKLRGWI